jgi:hypothetical protein
VFRMASRYCGLIIAFGGPEARSSIRHSASVMLSSCCAKAIIVQSTPTRPSSRTIIRQRQGSAATSANEASYGSGRSGLRVLRTMVRRRRPPIGIRGGYSGRRLPKLRHRGLSGGALQASGGRRALRCIGYARIGPGAAPTRPLRAPSWLLLCRRPGHYHKSRLT